MNPSTTLATVVVDELVRGGVREAVLSPGSRNAPLSLALHAADAASRLRLHVRIDERTAGFLALGLAKVSGVPVPVATTSGTAAANLHPAVLEAAHSGVPLLVLTADRPDELRGTGANQTIDQVGLYGGAVRLFRDVAAPDRRDGQNAYWRSLVGRALAATRGDLWGDPGPVHVNVGLREPLLPDGSSDWPEPLDGRPDCAPWVAMVEARPGGSGSYAGAPRTLVIVGDCSDELAAAATRLAAARGWPCVAEPLSPARADSLAGGALLLADPDFLAGHRPDRVLVVGRPTLSRPVGALRRDPAVVVDVVTDSPRWADPAGTACRVASAALLTGPEPPPTTEEPDSGKRGFRAEWHEAADRVSRAVATFLRDEPQLTGLHVAATVGEVLAPGALLVLGSSSPVRDVDLVGGRLPGVRPLSNRGVAGIDGTVSTAVGAALGYGGKGPAYALMGDLTFLHDANGLLIGPTEPRPDLCLVVVNDDGGAIFSLLEQGAPEHAGAFERVFGTPHNVDLAALCAATRTPHERVRSVDGLRAALRPRPGLRVVEAFVDRSQVRDLHDRLHRAVAAQAGSSPITPQ